VYNEFEVSDVDEKSGAGFRERLNDLIESSGKSATAIAADLGISKSAISTWQVGTRIPKYPTVETIARYFSVNAGWLLGQEPDHAAPKPKEAAKQLWYAPLIAAYAAAPDLTQRHVCKLLDISLVSAEQNRRKRKMAEMIVYDYPAAAGMPLYAEADFQRLPFPADEIPEGADFGVRISGDSMQPTILSGEVVWVHKTPEIYDGQIGIFMLGSDSVCKRARVRPDRKITQLESDNPAYAPIKGYDLAELRTVGRVLR